MTSRRAGQVLGGRYRLVNPLGSGGMGSVWRGEHLTLSSPVALKLIEPGAARDADVQHRFLREARTAAALRSPHVVQILDYGVDDDCPYIAMELLEGESLAARLERQPCLSAPETARIVRHIARALGRAHDAGVVHRDLKPENVFIVENDDEELAKVLDFGIVKADPNTFDSPSAGATTRTGTLLGTPYFMSPEQAEGVKSLDHRTDIWALGVIAYRCLLGKLPFTGDSVGRLILQICSRPLPVPSHHGPVPEGFDAWFARACARDPSDRFESAKEAAAELSRLTGDSASVAAEPAPAPTPSPLVLATTTLKSSNTEILPPPRQRPRPLALALAAVALVCLTAAIGVRLWSASKRARMRASETTLEQSVRALEPLAKAAAAVPPESPPVSAAAEPLAPPATSEPPASLELASEPAAPSEPAAMAPSTSPARLHPATHGAGPAPRHEPPASRAPSSIQPAARARPSRKPEPPPRARAKLQVDLGI